MPAHLPPGLKAAFIFEVCGQVAVLPGEGLWLWVVRSRWRTTFRPSIFTSIDHEVK